MSDFHPTFDQSYAYYARRLPEERMAKTRSVSVRCPFHGDKNPSMGINLEMGAWKCYVCNESGGVFAFEKKLYPNADNETLWKQIYEIMGIPQPAKRRSDSGRVLTATYDYVDVTGKTVYQKLRYEYPPEMAEPGAPAKPKTFSQRQPGPAGKGWVYNLDGVKKVLYHLPEVVTCQFAYIVEGEKDADNLAAAFDPYLNAHPDQRIATTCNFDGAAKDGPSKWLPQYNPYFAGKMVVILADNDEAGRRHAEQVAAGVSQYAEKVKVVALPGLAEHGDVSDWLKAGGTIEQLLKIVKETPLWKPEEREHKLLVELLDFMDVNAPEREWLVEGVIPARANGLLVADPKAGKSLLSFDLALALASGTPWLNFAVPRHCRVGLVSREDGPFQSQQRIKELMAGDPRRQEYNWGQIWLNTKHQSDQFLLDNGADVEAMIAELRMEQLDLVVFDVFNKLHTQDENDNTAISMVMRALDRVSVEANTSVLLIHHLAKAETGNVFKGSRGASAIHGFAEWGVALSVVDTEQPRRDWVRKVDFELKYGCPEDRRYFRVSGRKDVDVRIDVVDAPEQHSAAAPRREKVRQITAGQTWHEGRD